MPLSILFSSGLLALFYFATLVFVVYSVSIAYHWFAYGEKRTLSTLSLAVYLMVSAPLFLIMALSLQAI
jgi:hypothetical protein